MYESSSETATWLVDNLKLMEVSNAGSWNFIKITLKIKLLCNIPIRLVSVKKSTVYVPNATEPYLKDLIIFPLNLSLFK